MTKRVQLLGHDATTANAFIGEEREVTVDTENDHLRVHDGATPGGFRILNRDENDARYQARSVELDGLLGWEPNERGIPSRQGPSNYTLISIEVNTDQMTIDFANGFGGNPLIAFSPTITTNHTWSGAHIFTQTITGNLLGNVTGNLTGNVFGSVTGNVTGNLTGNATGAHSGSFIGAGVFSAITLPAACVGIAQLDSGLVDALDNAATFIGMISMYSGDPGDIPLNWNLCDGTNGTPDLRDKFIVCAGATYSEDTSGGAASHNHLVTVDSGGAHTHTGVISDTALSLAQMAPHSHGNGVTDSGTDLFCYGTKTAPSTPDSIDNNTNNGTIQGNTETVGGGATHTHALTVDSGGTHNHTGTVAGNSNLPPYYALAFVMRIS